MYNTIKNNNKYREQKIKIKYVGNNYYLLCMHAVFMGMTTASPNGCGGESSLQSGGV